MFAATLPAHCEPSTAFLHHLSSALGICIPSPLALVSSILGTLSILSWLFAQLPQILKNFSLGTTAGLSIWFLTEWCAGDASNLAGAVLTRQATWQIAVAGYYCIVDAVLVLQWCYYEYLGAARWRVRRYWRDDGDHTAEPRGFVDDGRSVSDSSSIRSGITGTLPRSAARDIFRPGVDGRLTPDSRGSAGSMPKEKLGGLSFASTPRRLVQMPSSSSVPGPSPRTVLLIACLISLARASPVGEQRTEGDQSWIVDIAGTALSWTSTALYLVSRLPQLYKNYKRQSTAGLSPLLFMAAFFGNLFYSSSILTNPCAWSDFGPYGGGGWVGPEGSVRSEWILRALPFWLGAAGVLTLDGLMGFQFLMYGEASKVVVVEEVDAKRKRRRWKRVSGWMRGWVPTFADARERTSRGERRRLVVNEAGQERRLYGTL